jgi:hypothetical protein
VSQVDDVSDSGETGVPDETRLLRAAMALGLGEVGNSDLGQELVHWLIRTRGQGEDRPEELEVFVTIDGCLEHAECLAGGSTQLMMDALGNHLGYTDASEAQVEWVRSIGEAIGPPVTSVWLEASADRLGAGWGFHGSFPLGEVLAVLPDIPARRTLARWAHALRLDHASELRGTLGTGPDSVLVTLPLEREQEALAAAMLLMSSLELEVFARELLEALLEGQTEVSFIVGLNDEGVCVLGVSVGDLPLESAILLIAATNGDEAGLARFEGTLGADGGRRATLWCDAGGVRIDFTYRVTD